MQKHVFAILLAIAFIGGALITYFIIPSQQTGEISQGDGEPKPLYWVAPMDPNFKRDKPGKSPMGMDLVPVYEETSAGNSPGTVTISPEIVNNLGVRIGKAVLMPLPDKIETVGYLRYDEDRMLHVHPRVEGWIEKLYIKASGDRVEKGQPLYALYSPELVNAQEEYLLAANQGSASLITAAENRLRSLLIPEASLKLLKAEGKVQQHVTFLAPQSGVVDVLKIREGFYVQPGTTLMSIASLESIWADAEILENQVSMIQTQQRVEMTLGYDTSRSWVGQVDYIYPQLEPQTRTLRVRLRFENRDRFLKPNMYAQVSINNEDSEERLVVPSEAVIRTGIQDRVVLALDDNQFKSVEVKIGKVQDRYSEILQGIREGDDVVISAQFLLDSESSISSDFIRMTKPDEMPESVWTELTVTQIYASEQKITASHPPIDDWDWPSMTMDFSAEKSTAVSDFYVGQSFHAQLTRQPDGSAKITEVHIMEGMEGHSNDDVPSATVTGVINAIDTNTRQINISRGEIEKWSRPPATMDFLLSGKLDISTLSVDANVEFTFEIRNDEFVIVSMKPLK